MKLMQRILLLLLSLVGGLSMADTCYASNSIHFNEMNVGISVVLDPAAYSEEKYQAALEYVAASDGSVDLKKEGENKLLKDLVMSDVVESVNVRAEADENSEKVGLLYADCGGTMLEQTKGWTKIESGDLTGWVSNDYLLFGEEAQTEALNVGNFIAVSQADTLRVRKEPSLDSGIRGLIQRGEELNVVEDLNDDWISVDFEDAVGYVSKDYLTVEFYIDHGETMESIQEREAAEAAEKAKRKAKQAAVMTSGDDVRLLGALIQSEAGRESYEGKLAVGAVVMNRVRSGGYPNSISGVIYASGQFPPALNGTVANIFNGSVKDSCLQAAQAAIQGETNIGTATHFRRAGSRDGIVIGNHVFW